MFSRQRLIDHLGSRQNVQLAVLFGSAARGDLGPRSDVDIGLRLGVDTTETRRQVEVALGRVAGREVDIVHLDEAAPLLRFEIAREGVLLLERVPHAWADFKARAMIDWWDWAPVARSIHAAAIQRLRQRVERGET